MSIHYGDIGRALSTLCPSGAVDVLGERLDARSDGQVIEAGSLVVVLRGDPTGYVVQKLNPGQTPPKVPNHGQPIPKAEFQLSHAEAAAVERQEQADRRKRLRQGLRAGCLLGGKLGCLLGLGCGGIAWGCGWFGVAEVGSIVVLFGASLLIGAVAGIAFFLVMTLFSYSLGGAEG
jgi:hypothetical protein